MVRGWGFLPFVAIGVLHVVSLGFGWIDGAHVTKALLMPSLLVAMLIALPRRRSEFAVWGSVTLIFATLGDVLLGMPGELGFLVGVGAFLLAHVGYIVLFLRPARQGRVTWHAVVFLAWLVVFLTMLLPHTGSLAIPVALYGVIVCSSAIASLATTPLVSLGAVLFLVSDSLLGFRMFYPGFELWQEDAVIMTLYIAGQGIMILGTVLIAQRLEREAGELPRVVAVPA